MNWPLVALLLAQLSLPAHNETMEVVVANVDVTVLDKDGTHVTGLLPDDFEILDNGVPQRITNIGDEDLVFLCVCTPRFVQRAYISGR